MARFSYRQRPPLSAATLDAGSVSTPTVPLTPLEFLTLHLGIEPDPKQAELLRNDPHRCILNCSRQWGKSTITAAKAVHKACTQPGSLTIVLSPSARQSGEFVMKARYFLSTLGLSAASDGHNEISLALRNGSRIVGLPSNEGKIRGFSSVALLLIDEAARVQDSLYQAVRPMLAASDGQLWLMSTPAGRTGFFFREWSSHAADWLRFSIPASDCPRIGKRFLDEERRALPAQTFRQEYCCEFLDPEDAVFPTQLLEQAFTDAPPLIAIPEEGSNIVFLPPSDIHLRTAFDEAARAAGTPPKLDPPYYFIGVDFGQSEDYTAICIIERAEILAGPRSPMTYDWPRRMLYTVRYLERFPLGTPYPDIIDAICRLVRNSALIGRCQIIVDGTGVGTPVVQMLRRQSPGPIVHSVILTSGTGHSRAGDTHRLPRAELLARIECAFQNSSLHISRHLPLSNALFLELQSLRRKHRNTGFETILPDRESDHDDLVFATALAHWRTTW
ncbi:MAG: terminase family protein [Bryobacterales bacterium]|nr:terminase family protein [Bryobacterales bacterium]